MKILVTGGAGLIGSRIAEKLLERGDEVAVIDNFATGRPDNIPQSPNLKIVEGSIGEQSFVLSTFDEFQPEVVVHCAASYKNPDDWEEDIKSNILGTINVIRGFQKAGCRRMIYLQTALCYGLNPKEQPITLSHPLVPEGSSYAYSKTVAEQYIQLSGIDYITFRLANVYGPRTVAGPLPIFYDRLVQNKPCFVMDTRRDFVFVDDLAEVVLKAIDGHGERGAYHASSGSDFAIKDLYDATIETMGITPEHEVEVRPRDPGDAYTLLLDPSKTQRDFEWKPKTPLQKGVKTAIEWYKNHRVQKAYTHLRHDEN